jgi:hypothetical protein
MVMVSDHVQPSCAIVIRTYRRDLDWLEYCLGALARHCAGFEEIVVVMPSRSEPYAQRSSVDFSGVRQVWCPDHADDYLGQQVTKLYADHLVDTDLICHFDADMVVSGPLSPAQLVVGGRPMVVTGPVGIRDPWGECSEQFLGWPVTKAFMVRPPFVFPRWLYEEVRRHCIARHRTDLASYVLSRSPRGFSEFTVLGAYALARHPAAFEWVDQSARLPQVCRWFWSWDRVTPAVRRELGPTGDGGITGSAR